MESNHLPLGYEPSELPMLHTAIKKNKKLGATLTHSLSNEIYMPRSAIETAAFVSYLFFLVTEF